MANNPLDSMPNVGANPLDSMPNVGARAPRTLPLTDVGGNLLALGREAKDFAVGANAAIGRTVGGLLQLAGVPAADTRKLYAPQPNDAAGRLGAVAGDTALIAFPFGDVATPAALIGRSALMNAAQPGSLVQRAESGAAGAALGALGVGAQKGAEALAAPAADVGKAAREKAIALAEKHGVPLHLGELLDSRAARTLTAGVSKLPLSGSLAALRRTLTAFNRAVADVAHIPGGVVDKGTVRAALERAGAKYDELWADSRSAIREPQIGQLGHILVKVNREGSLESRAQIPGLVRHVLDEAKANGGSIPGGELRAILKADLRPKLASKDPDVREAAFGIRNALISGMAEPDAAALRAADREYGNLKTLESALSGRAGVAGPLQPAAIASHISKRYGITPEMEEMARLGLFVRPPPEGSPTAERYLLYRALGAAGAFGEGADQYKQGHRLVGEGLGVLGSGLVLGGALNSDAAGRALLSLQRSGIAGQTQDAIRALAHASAEVAPAALAARSQR